MAVRHQDRGRDLHDVNEHSATATRGEEFVYMFFVTWTLIGLCLDGWAHRSQPELETFFTPWHAVFYTGFIGAAAWLAFIVIRRRPHTTDLRSSIPDGYELAVVGLGVFALGGVGDAVWHTIFGVETSLDALLSPTHLVMLISMLGGATAPIRSAWRSSESPLAPAGLGQFLPVALSFTVVTTAVAFFFLYANGFNNWPMQFSFVPGGDEVSAALAILSTLASTVILLAPVMLMLRRWRPPIGTFTFMFAVLGIFMSGLDAFEHGWQIIAPAVGGAVLDVTVASARHRPGPITDPAGMRATAHRAGLLVPLAMWSVSTYTTHVNWTVAWPPELWVGNIVMAALAGLGLAVISFPPGLPDGVHEAR